jgi:hypothetical protein
LFEKFFRLFEKFFGRTPRWQKPRTVCVHEGHEQSAVHFVIRYHRLLRLALRLFTYQSLHRLLASQMGGCSDDEETFKGCGPKTWQSLDTCRAA